MNEDISNIISVNKEVWSKKQKMKRMEMSVDFVLVSLIVLFFVMSLLGFAQ